MNIRSSSISDPSVSPKKNPSVTGKNLLKISASSRSRSSRSSKTKSQLKCLPLPPFLRYSASIQLCKFGCFLQYFITSASLTLKSTGCSIASRVLQAYISNPITFSFLKRFCPMGVFAQQRAKAAAVNGQHGPQGVVRAAH